MLCDPEGISVAVHERGFWGTQLKQENHQNWSVKTDFIKTTVFWSLAGAEGWVMDDPCHLLQHSGKQQSIDIAVEPQTLTAQRPLHLLKEAARSSETVSMATWQRLPPGALGLSAASTGWKLRKASEVRGRSICSRVTERAGAGCGWNKCLVFSDSPCCATLAAVLPTFLPQVMTCCHSSRLACRYIYSANYVNWDDGFKKCRRKKYHRGRRQLRFQRLSMAERVTQLATYHWGPDVLHWRLSGGEGEGSCGLHQHLRELSFSAGCPVTVLI